MSELKKDQQEQDKPKEISGVKAALGKVLFVIVLLAIITVVVIGADWIINWITGLWS